MFTLDACEIFGICAAFFGSVMERLCRHMMEQAPLDNLKTLWKFIKSHQENNRVHNKHGQRLFKLSMFQKQKDFPKMKGKAAEINGLCGAFLFMWNDLSRTRMSSGKRSYS